MDNSNGRSGVNGKPKARRYSFDAETEAWLEQEAQAGHTSVAGIVDWLVREKRAEFEREEQEVANLYAVSKSGPILGLDES